MTTIGYTPCGAPASPLARGETRRGLGNNDGPTRSGRRSRRFVRSLLIASPTVLYAVFSACEPIGPPPGLLRFGSDGHVRVTVEVPLQGGIGWLQQVLSWNSDGAWKLFEEIGYDSVLGDNNMRRNPGQPFVYAANYSSLLQLAIDNEGTRLWEPPDQVGADECGIGRSRVSIVIRDNQRDEEKEWARCAANASALAHLSTGGFEPDDGAARVIQIALRARDFTLGEDFENYAYTGSLPFATIDRGTRSGTEVNDGLVFRTPEGVSEAPEGWSPFWRRHTGGDGAPPDIDWENEMVVVAAIGRREWTGDSVEVRRVLLVGAEIPGMTRTKIEMVERKAGNYCAPARRVVWPYHIVVTPRGPPADFSRRREIVDCEA